MHNRGDDVSRRMFTSIGRVADGVWRMAIRCSCKLILSYAVVVAVAAASGGDDGLTGWLYVRGWWLVGWWMVVQSESSLEQLPKWMLIFWRVEISS